VWRRGLVQQDQIRVGHQGLGYGQELDLTAGQTPGNVIALLEKPDALQELLGSLDHLPILPTNCTPAREYRNRILAGQALTGHEHVLHYRHASRHLRDLKGSHHTAIRNAVGRQVADRLSTERDGAPVLLVETGDDVEKRRLAGAVRPDQPRNRPFPNREGDISERLEAPERLVDISNVQHGLFPPSPKCLTRHRFLCTFPAT
jgi:hypothetical protein